MKMAEEKKIDPERYISFKRIEKDIGWRLINGYLISELKWVTSVKTLPFLRMWS